MFENTTDSGPLHSSTHPEFKLFYVPEPEVQISKLANGYILNVNGCKYVFLTLTAMFNKITEVLEPKKSTPAPSRTPLKKK